MMRLHVSLLSWLLVVVVANGCDDDVASPYTPLKTAEQSRMLANTNDVHFQKWLRYIEPFIAETARNGQYSVKIPFPNWCYRPTTYGGEPEPHCFDTNHQRVPIWLWLGRNQYLVTQTCWDFSLNYYHQRNGGHISAQRDGGQEIKKEEINLSHHHNSVYERARYRKEIDTSSKPQRVVDEEKLLADGRYIKNPNMHEVKEKLFSDFNCSFVLSFW